MKLFMWAAYNAYVMQHCFRLHNAPGKHVTTFHIFTEELCHQVVGTFRHDPASVSHHVSDMCDTRLLNERLVPIHMPYVLFVTNASCK